VVEEEILPWAIQAVAEMVGLPISIDMATHEALTAALAICPGKPLVNSITSEESSLKREPSGNLVITTIRSDDPFKRE